MRSTLALVMLGLTLVASCSPSGSGSLAPSLLPPTSPLTTTDAVTGSTSPSSAGPTATDVAVTSPRPFALSSPDFDDGAPIPRSATCDGADASPALVWTAAPTGTQSLVLVVLDPDAHDFVHWVAFDLTGVPDGRVAGGVSAGAASPGQGRNDFGKRGYGGPCPPSGQHRYAFTVYALDRPLGIGGTPSLANVQAAMKGHVLGQAGLTGTYRRR